MSNKVCLHIAIGCFLLISNCIATPDDLPYKEGELLVRFAPKAKGIQRSTIEREQLLSSLNAGQVKYSYKRVQGLTLVKLPAGQTVADALSKFKGKSEFLYAEPNYKIKLLSTFPNDPRGSNPVDGGEQWALHNTGQTGGTLDADIDAPEAWDIIHDACDIIVAVIDTGVNYKHPDLAANMWLNPGEDHPPLGVVGPEDFDGINDDNNYDGSGNPLIDDIYGYDFCYNNSDPNDYIDFGGHGTNCAGIIGAVGNNNEGITGVCWNVKIMALKFINVNGWGWSSNAIKCIEYAVDMGAKVLNISWGLIDILGITVSSTDLPITPPIYQNGRLTIWSLLVV